MRCFVATPDQCPKYPKDITRENTLFYPEARMTFRQICTTGCPRDYNIVTDEAWLVALYDREEVFVWKGERWQNPNVQTFGADPSTLWPEIWGVTHTIPGAVLSGKHVTNCMGT